MAKKERKYEKFLQLYYPEYKLQLVGRGFTKASPINYDQKCALSLKECLERCSEGTKEYTWEEVTYEVASRCCACINCMNYCGHEANENTVHFVFKRNESQKGTPGVRVST